MILEYESMSSPCRVQDYNDLYHALEYHKLVACVNVCRNPVFMKNTEAQDQGVVQGGWLLENLGILSKHRRISGSKRSIGKYLLGH